MLIIDADNFKSVNDRFGHDRGDEALITIAKSIKTMLRGPDLVGRLGGEEFGVFLPGATTEQAENVAERIRQTGQRCRIHAGRRPPPALGEAWAVQCSSRNCRLPSSSAWRTSSSMRPSKAGRNRVAIAPIRPGPMALVAA